MGYLTFDVNVVFRRNSTIDWAKPENDVVIRAGELVIDTTTNQFKIGNGEQKYSELPFAGFGGGMPLSQVPMSENVRPPLIVDAPNHTLSNADVGKMIVLTRMNEANPGTEILIPSGVLGVGVVIKGINITHRDLTFAVASGVTITPTGHIVHGEMGQFQLYQYAQDKWYLTGDVGIPST